MKSCECGNAAVVLTLFMAQHGVGSDIFQNCVLLSPVKHNISFYTKIYEDGFTIKSFLIETYNGKFNLLR